MNQTIKNINLNHQKASLFGKTGIGANRNFDLEVIHSNHGTPASEVENDIYFYHTDHLGSSSWITYTDGSVTQHLQSLPFGEPFIDQRATSYDIRFKFTGKEMDTETGYQYFGARYYNSDISVWFSACPPQPKWRRMDPLSDKYPSMSAYMYTAGNPVMLVNPDGRIIWIVDNDGNHIVYSPGMTVPKESSKFVSDAIIGLNFLYNNPEGDYNRVDNIHKSNVVLQIKKQTPGKPSTYNGVWCVINWDNVSIDVYNEGSQSPIVGLAHEIDHADKSVLAWEKVFEFEKKGDTRSDEYNKACSEAYQHGDAPEDDRNKWEKLAMDYENFIGGKKYNDKKLSTYQRKEYIAPVKQKEAETIFSIE